MANSMTNPFVRPGILLLSLICASALLGCGTSPKPEANAAPAAPNSEAPAATSLQSPPVAASTAEAPSPTRAPAPLIVPIESRSGSNLKGTATLETVGNAVRVVLDVTGGPPGQHGAHIHQNADCSSTDGKSAGDHFNPEMHAHGLPPTSQRHLGDLGNIELDKDGKGHLEIVISGANLNENDKMSFLNRAIIIHEKIDDGGQPVGNAGSRIGCGEIKR